LVVGDIREPDVVRRALDGVDGCFHLAAVVSVARCESEWEHSHQVNLTGSVNVFRAAAKRPSPIPVVYASSAAVYGNALELPAREDAAPLPINVYGADKAACELHAGAITRASTASITGLRFFNVYGSGQNPDSVYSGVVSVFCERLMKGEPLTIYGDGKQTRDFIHVFDVVQAMLNAMRKAQPGARVYNVCTGKSTTVLELAHMIGELAGAVPQIRFERARDADIAHSLGDPSRAAAGLNFQASVPMVTGLVELISDLQENREPLRRPVRIAAQ
jgi:UDP-glucose 4-epimerase